MTVKEGLQVALAAFGPNGENWAKGGEGSVVPTGKVCAATAAGNAALTTDVELFFKMRRFLYAALPEGYAALVRFNDAPATTFEDIRALYNRAIEAANEM